MIYINLSDFQQHDLLYVKWAFIDITYQIRITYTKNKSDKNVKEKEQSVTPWGIVNKFAPWR